MRERIRAERQGRSPQQRRQDAEDLTDVLLELPEVARSGCVATYASIGGEPGTHHLRATLARLGVRILLPVSLADGTLDWAEDAGELRPGRGPGGPEPAGPRLGADGVRQAGVILAPALAVDTLGNRLGQGGGFYDRTLGRLDAAVPVLALVHESEVLDAAVEPVPAGPHDRPVDAAVTPRRCLRLSLPRH
jgi:5-formyltetrahydrofolate cyclo-ligase